MKKIVSNDKETLNLPTYAIYGKHDLSLFVQVGQEGIGQTYLTKLKYGSVANADLFEIEDQLIPERERLQRDAEKPRIKKIENYLINRENTVFPSACLIVTELKLEPLVEGCNEIMRATIPHTADRLFIDGQHRVGGISSSVEIKPELANYHLDVKIIVVPTKTIRESAAFVTQIFSDYHMSQKSPNTSQNIYFDNEGYSSLFAKELLEMCNKLDINFDKAVAVNGKVKHGQLYTFAIMLDFVSIMIGENNKEKLNELLADEATYNLYLMLITDFLGGLYKHLPFNKIQSMENRAEWKAATNGCVLTCAIGLKALAYFGRSLIEDALEKEVSELDLSTISKLSELPLEEKSSKVWIDSEIYQVIDEKLKIVRASEKRLGRLMCNKARVLACKGLI